MLHTHISCITLPSSSLSICSYHLCLFTSPFQQNIFPSFSNLICFLSNPITLIIGVFHFIFRICIFLSLTFHTLHNHVLGTTAPSHIIIFAFAPMMMMMSNLFFFFFIMSSLMTHICLHRPYFNSVQQNCTTSSIVLTIQDCLSSS